MNAFGIFNAIEAAWWIGCGLWLIVRGRAVCGMTPRLRWTLAALLIGFGISDLIEIRTEAWYRPAGLLILNAICVTGLITCGFLLHRRRRIESAPDAEPDA